LPESCKTALLNIALNPEASSCLNTPVIMNTVLDIKQAGIDPVATLNTYISGMCNSGMCSNQTLTDIVKNVTAGCSGYALDYGFDIAGEAMDLNIALVLEAYPTARNVACLKECISCSLPACLCLFLTAIYRTSTDGFCAVSTFNRSILDYAIDSDNSISGLYQTLMDAYVRGITPAKIERSCTPCTKAAWSLVRNASSELREENDGNIARVCGANFTGEYSFLC
jgi:hypothetical protein